MWLHINTDDITFATGTASRILTSKTSGHSAGIRLTAEDNSLTLTANDQEIGITCTIPAEVRECGSLVVPGKLFSEAVRRFPGEETELRVPDGKQMLSISCASTSIDLVGISPTNFPELPDINDFTRLSIPQKILKSMLKQIAFAISEDDMRPILTGMLWEHTDGVLRMVAADGFRVASRKEVLENPDEDFRVVVPGRAITEIIRLLDDSADPAEIAVGRNHILIRIGATTIISRLLEGKYLNVDQFLPTTFVTELVVKPKALLEALDRAGVVAKDGSSGTVKLQIKQGTLTVRAQSAEYGSHFEEWPVEVTGEDLEIHFNIRILSDVLKSAEQGDILMKFTGNQGPSISECPGKDNFWSLVMPVRLS